jgi:hypothetical protein
MENQTAIIEIKKLEMTAYETGSQYKITAQDGKKYKFYDKKKDGNPTVAFTQFGNMQLKMGSTCEVWFKEIEKEYEGKPYTDRIIASFKEANAKPLSHATPAQKAPVKPNSYVPELFKQRNFKQEGYEKCLWGYWLEHSERIGDKLYPNLQALSDKEMDLVWMVFNQIEKDAEKRFNGGLNGATEMNSADEAPPLEEYPNS